MPHAAREMGSITPVAKCRSVTNFFRFPSKPPLSTVKCCVTWDDGNIPPYDPDRNPHGNYLSTAFWWIMDFQTHKSVFVCIRSVAINENKHLVILIRTRFRFDDTSRINDLICLTIEEEPFKSAFDDDNFHQTEIHSVMKANLTNEARADPSYCAWR